MSGAPPAAALVPTCFGGGACNPGVKRRAAETAGGRVSARALCPAHNPHATPRRGAPAARAPSPAMDAGVLALVVLLLAVLAAAAVALRALAAGDGDARREPPAGAAADEPVLVREARGGTCEPHRGIGHLLHRSSTDPSSPPEQPGRPPASRPPRRRRAPPRSGRGGRGRGRGSGPRRRRRGGEARRGCGLMVGRDGRRSRRRRPTRN